MINRRAFIASASGLAASMAAGPSLQALSGAFSRRWRVGLIGCGWYGGVNLLRLSQVATIELVALCDVDQAALENTRSRFASLIGARPQLYADYRRMLETHRLDIVIVACPDHWHALPAIAAMRSGAHVYLEKPVSVDIIEGEALVSAARKYRRVAQVGLQRRSMPHLAEAKRTFVDSGRLGRIGQVETFCYIPTLPTEPPPPSDPLPSLDYDAWTGPAPLLPFSGDKHPGGWRAYAEYGNGIIGDMGVHQLDLVRWMLGLGWPRATFSSGGSFSRAESLGYVADRQQAIFGFGELQVTWQHRIWGAAPEPKTHWTKQWGATLHGELGSLRLTSIDAEFVPANGGSPQLLPAIEEEIDAGETGYDAIDRAAGPAERRHMLDLLQAIETGSDPICSVGQGHVSTACCIMANLSMQLGRSIAYDPQTRTVTGDPVATRLLRRPYRHPWRHPEPESV